ncbi:MAG: class I SAM-dependent methyltransferase [Candidatus Yanofskybacteria bacterium]|nr:class I SAM-dependent methyltransferase [Candidatus Yanofskybacteria bacterium]
MKDKNYNTSNFKKVELSELPLYEFTGSQEDRWKATNGIIDNILNQYESRLGSFKTLDLALGGGHDSIFLIKKGYDVVSNEIEDVYIDQAKQNATKEGVILNVRKCYWQEMDKNSLYQPSEFDFIFCLGNSFPNYLLSENDRTKSLRNFWTILKTGGVLFFDSRNFDYMIENKDFILQDPEANFKYAGKTTFLNKELVHGFPVEITNNIVHFVWKHYGKKAYAEMDLWPATTENVKKLIQDSIGNVRYEILYDYQKQKPEQYDFIQYLLYKD